MAGLSFNVKLRLVLVALLVPIALFAFLLGTSTPGRITSYEADFFARAILFNERSDHGSRYLSVNFETGRTRRSDGCHIQASLNSKRIDQWQLIDDTTDNLRMNDRYQYRIVCHSDTPPYERSFEFKRPVDLMPGGFLFYFDSGTLHWIHCSDPQLTPQATSVQLNGKGIFLSYPGSPNIYFATVSSGRYLMTSFEMRGNQLVLIRETQVTGFPIWLDHQSVACLDENEKRIEFCDPTTGAVIQSIALPSVEAWYAKLWGRTYVVPSEQLENEVFDVERRQWLRNPNPKARFCGVVGDRAVYQAGESVLETIAIGDSIDPEKVSFSVGDFRGVLPISGDLSEWSSNPSAWTPTIQKQESY